METGYGRSDLIIPDPADNRALILELKHVKKPADIDQALAEAASQIVKKKYESKLIYHGYTSVLKYGMVFHDKRAHIRLVNDTDSDSPRVRSD